MAILMFSFLRFYIVDDSEGGSSSLNSVWGFDPCFGQAMIQTNTRVSFVAVPH